MKKENVCGSYCIENRNNGKKYIGYAKNVEERIYKHVWDLEHNKHDNKYLQNTFNKHGYEIFIFYIVEECLIDELCEKEKYYIDEFNTKCPKGYNMTDGGEGQLGFVHSDETKEFLSKIGLGSLNHFFGKHHSKESKEKISNSKKGQIPWNLGIPRTDEEKRKISQNREKTTSFLGKNHTDDSKIKMSKSKENKKMKDSSSIYFGVSKATSNSWRCSIYINKKTIKLGTFKNEIDAAKAYDKYVIGNKLTDIKKLNFVD